MQSLLNQTAIFTPKTAFDGYGRSIDGVASPLACRFENKTRTRQLPNDQVVEILGKCWINGNPGIVTNDKITISGVDYQVHSVDGQIDGAGNTHHTTLELVKWTE